MSRPIYPIKALLLGLLTAQLLATVFVHKSNLELYEKISVIEAAGYLTVPNQEIKPQLLTWRPAFYGGLFFTFSLGAGLSLAALAAAWLWVRPAGGRPAVLILLALAWLGGLAAVNLAGFDFMASVFLFTVPPVVFFFSSRTRSDRTETVGRPGIWAFILPLILAALVWGFRADRDIFLDIRDFLLMANRPGQRINDFYYKYTLYPAESFKSLAQKTLRTCRIEVSSDPVLAAELEKTMPVFDYLPLPGPGPADLEIAGQQGDLVLLRGRSEVLRLDPAEFLADPGRSLVKFSSLTDRRSPLRRATFYSLIAGLPLTIYLCLFSLVFWLGRRRFKSGPASVMAGLVCLALCVSALAPIHLAKSGASGKQSTAELLSSPDWTDRVMGLRLVEASNLEIGNFANYRRFLTSPHAPERYWLAGALGRSRLPANHGAITALLADHQPNVVCAALEALGRRGRGTDAPEILKIIKTSDHWYVQWYAYRALRSLGWSQTASN